MSHLSAATEFMFKQHPYYMEKTEISNFNVSVLCFRKLGTY